MLRLLIAGATFLAMFAVTLSNVAAAEPQRPATAAAVPAAAPTVEVYSNPG